MYEYAGPIASIQTRARKKNSFLEIISIYTCLTSYSRGRKCQNSSRALHLVDSFEKFFRGSGVGATPGAGLGLSIARSLVVDALAFPLLATVLVGARVGYVVSHPQEFVGDPLAAIRPPFAGLASHGAIAFGLASVFGLDYQLARWPTWNYQWPGTGTGAARWPRVVYPSLLAFAGRHFLGPRL